MHCITYSALYSLLRVEPYLVLCCLLMPCHLKTYICICTVSSTAYGHDGCTYTLPGTTSASLTHAGCYQSASGVARQSYTTTATPADSTAIPQALRERRLELAVLRARRHAACEFDLRVDNLTWDMARLICPKSSSTSLLTVRPYFEPYFEPCTVRTLY